MLVSGLLVFNKLDLSVDYGCLTNWVDRWIMVFNKLGWLVDYGCLANWVGRWIMGV